MLITLSLYTIIINQLCFVISLLLNAVAIFIVCSFIFFFLGSEGGRPVPVRLTENYFFIAVIRKEK